MDVHKVEFFVEDKRLAQINRLVAGLVFEFKAVPVVNAKATNGKVQAVNENGAIGVILKGLKPGVRITSQEAKAKLIEAGFGVKRHHVVLYELKKAGVLRSVALGVYELAKAGKSKSKSRNKA